MPVVTFDQTHPRRPRSTPPPNGTCARLEAKLRRLAVIRPIAVRVIERQVDRLLFRYDTEARDGAARCVKLAVPDSQAVRLIEMCIDRVLGEHERG
jgi:hypothetical protein